jgi:fermentation-respiration switch protein FrsA (DUF1100 family)
MSLTLAVVLGLAGLYVAICALALVFEERLVYFPTRELGARPDAVGLTYQDVRFQAGDGTRLHGWWLPAQPARAVVLLCHGNGGNISDRLAAYHFLHGLGLSVLAFDYRGYGRSSGRPTEEGTYRDARAAWAHLVNERGVPPERILIYGRSLGGAVAVELAAGVRPRAVILDATFTSLPELGARLYPWLPVRQLSRIRYDSAARIRDVTAPKLFLHSLRDDVVPYALGLRLYRQARPPKTLARHRTGHDDEGRFQEDAYIEAWQRFLGELRLEGGAPADHD